MKPYQDEEKSMRPSHSQEILMDSIYQNERGFKEQSKWSFSKKQLLPTDPSPFSTLENKFSVDIRFITPPPSFTWVSDWMLDLNGNVDEQGWSYATSFKGVWESNVPPKATVVVRRRKWTRMRRIITTTMPGVLNKADKMSGKDDGISSVNDATVTELVQREDIDRKRIDALRKVINDTTMTAEVIGAILEEFDYEGSRLDACILFKNILKQDQRLLLVAINSLRFYSDRKALVDIVGVRLPDLQKAVDLKDSLDGGNSAILKPEATNSSEETSINRAI